MTKENSNPKGQHITNLSLAQDTALVLNMVGNHQPTFVARTGKQKLLAKLKLGSQQDIALDMDIGCGCYDEQGALLDVVWYGKVRAFDSMVRLAYDTFIGMNKTYVPTSVEEVLSIRLPHLPKQVTHLALFVHCYDGYALKQLVAGRVGLKTGDHHSVHELALAECADGVAGVCLWQLHREGDVWQVWAINEPVAGDTIGKMATHWQVKKH